MLAYVGFPFPKLLYTNLGTIQLITAFNAFRSKVKLTSTLAVIERLYLYFFISQFETVKSLKQVFFKYKKLNRGRVRKLPGITCTYDP